MLPPCCACLHKIAHSFCSILKISGNVDGLQLSFCSVIEEIFFFFLTHFSALFFSFAMYVCNSEETLVSNDSIYSCIEAKKIS